MKTLKFKTNINCSGCLAKVTPALDNSEEIAEWHVDTENKDKVLTVSGNKIEEGKVIEVIANIGFKASPIR